MGINSHPPFISNTTSMIPMMWKFPTKNHGFKFRGCLFWWRMGLVVAKKGELRWLTSWTNPTYGGVLKYGWFLIGNILSRNGWWLGIPPWLWKSDISIKIWPTGCNHAMPPLRSWVFMASGPLCAQSVRILIPSFKWTTETLWNDVFLTREEDPSFWHLGISCFHGGYP